jgi:hypothetical protein
VPVERNWSVPEDEHRQPHIGVTADGDLFVQPRVVRDDDPDGLLEAAFEVVSILRRVGGTIQIAAQRAEVAPDVVVTESYIFAYNSFTPLVRRLGDAPQAADEPEPLTKEEIAAHFPADESPMQQIVEEAKQEEPADADASPAVAAVE